MSSYLVQVYDRETLVPTSIGSRTLLSEEVVTHPLPQGENPRSMDSKLTEVQFQFPLVSDHQVTSQATCPQFAYSGHKREVPKCQTRYQVVETWDTARTNEGVSRSA